MKLKKILSLIIAIAMLFSSMSFSVFAEETPTEGYMLYILNADGTIGMDIDGTKSVSEFSLKTAIEDARVFVDNAFLFGITTPATYVVEMYEDSIETESFEIDSDVTINGNGHNIVLAEGVELTNNGVINDAVIVDPNQTTAIAKIGDTGYATLAEAIAAAVDGDTIELLADATIDTTTNITKSVTINGNGNKLTQSDDFSSNAANAMLDIMNGAIVTFNDITFDGIKDVAIMRTVSANVVIDNCVITNCEQTVVQGLLRLACGDATITDSQFINNDCTMVVSFGFDAANDTDVLTIDGCLFEGNTCGETAVVYFADGDYGTVTNTKFINNTVSSAGNAATLYMGWGDGFEVFGCTFEGNTVTTSHATTKRFASAIFCDGCTVNENVFKDNTAIRNGETISTTVAVAAYYGEANISENYWGSSDEPVAGTDYTVEYTRNTVTNESYYAAITEDGTIDSNSLKSLVRLARIGDVEYETVAAALEAAQTAGMTDVTITLIGETTKDSAIALEDAFNLYTKNEFDSITFKQEDPSKVYYIDAIYTGSRTNGGEFVFDGVNILVVGQYIFEGNVKLINNSYIESTTESNCFFYSTTTTIEPGSKIKGIIEDFRGGKVIVDGGKTDGTYNETPAIQDSIMHIRWSGDSLTLKNGAFVKVNAVNEVGRINLAAGTSINMTASKLESWQYIDNNGEINTDVNSIITTKKITGAGAITIDATDFDCADVQVIEADMSEFAGTITVTGNDDAMYKITDSGVVIVVAELPVASITDSEGNTTNYKTLTEAIAAAVDGDTIELLSDIEMSDSVVISNKALTIDLGEYTIYDKNTNVLTSNDDVWGLIELKDNASLTVCGNGKIECKYTVVKDGWTGMAYCFNVDKTSELTINSGSFTNGNGGIQTFGKVTVNNGTFVSYNGGTCIMAIGSSANVSVNDGIFKDSVEDDDVYTGSGAVWSGFGATVNINGGTYDFAADPEHDNVVWTLFPAQNAISGYGENASMTVYGGTFVNFNPATDAVIDYSASEGFTYGSVVAEGYKVTQNEDGTYGVEKLPPALPTATVSEPVINTTVMAMNGINGEAFETPVTFKMNFSANEPTDEQRAYYSKWLADYELIINKDIRGTDAYLVGQYDSWSENWVKLASDTDEIILNANTPIKVVKDLMNLELEYEADILGWVKDFDCGIYFTPEFIAANPDLEVTLALKIYNPENPDESYVIGEAYEFTAEDAKQEETTELFRFVEISASLDSSIALNIYLNSSELTGEDYYAVVEHTKATGDVITTNIPYADWVTSGNRKLIRYTGIAAKEMADKIIITVYKADGTQASIAYETSLRDYAIGMLNLYSQYDSYSHWLPVFVDMLNYGAAAQSIFKYNTSNPASAGAEDFQKYASLDYTLDKNGCSAEGTASEVSLTLEDMIILNAYFRDVTEGMYATYCYTTHAGTQIEERVDYDSFISKSSYLGVPVDVAIADAATLVTVTMFNSDSTEAGKVVYSVNGYLKGMIDNGATDEIYPALAKFAASAKAAFAK